MHPDFIASGLKIGIPSTIQGAVFCFANIFGQTATTFTSQNYAAGQYNRCKKILWVCLICSIVSSMILIEPLVIFRRFFAGFFSTEQLVIQKACLRIMCILFFEPLCNLYEIPAGVLRGSGHSLYPAVATIIGTCCFRILWMCTVFQQYHELNVLYYAFPISWVVTILLVVIGNCNLNVVVQMYMRKNERLFKSLRVCMLYGIGW